MGARIHPSWPVQPGLATDHGRARDGPVQSRKLSLSSKEGLKTALDAVMAKYEPELPGVAYGVTSADGVLYACCRGHTDRRGRNAQEDLLTFLANVRRPMDEMQPVALGRGVEGAGATDAADGRVAGSAPWLGTGRTEYCIDAKMGVAVSSEGCCG